MPPKVDFLKNLVGTATAHRSNTLPTNAFGEPL